MHRINLTNAHILFHPQCDCLYHQLHLVNNARQGDHDHQRHYRQNVTPTKDQAKEVFWPKS